MAFDAFTLLSVRVRGRNQEVPWKRAVEPANRTISALYKVFTMVPAEQSIRVAVSVTFSLSLESANITLLSMHRRNLRQNLFANKQIVIELPKINVLQPGTQSSDTVPIHIRST